ncbi:MAG: sugar phosphate isomerase/epimerase family protein [Planctomycetaceae bacterium]|nr:sugar phosphate isomerase/epimerase [Planctomycetaceae bacterium]
MSIDNDFGISTHCLAGIDPAGHLPLFERFGFTSVELNLGYWPWLADGAALAQLKKMLDGCGLSVWAYHMPYAATVPEAGLIDPAHPDAAVREGTVAAVAWCLERVADLGGRRLIIHPNASHLQADRRSEAMGLCRRTLRACVEQLEALCRRRHDARGIVLAVEPMPPWGLLNRPDEVEAMADLFDGRRAGLCLDVNHINLAGQDPIEYVRRIGRFVCTTHLSDNDGLDERHWAPGRGVLPWEQLLAELERSGYKGPLMFETGQFGADAKDTVAQLAGLREKLRTGTLER